MSAISSRLRQPQIADLRGGGVSALPANNKMQHMQILPVAGSNESMYY